MYPARFDYLKVDSFASASAALLSGGAGAKALAGGQTLIPMLKLRLLKPELIIDPTPAADGAGREVTYDFVLAGDKIASLEIR